MWQTILFMSAGEKGVDSGVLFCILGTVVERNEIKVWRADGGGGCFVDINS
jgi:hypothetical protein